MPQGLKALKEANEKAEAKAREKKIALAWKITDAISMNLDVGCTDNEIFDVVLDALRNRI